ncbi:N-acetylmuramoyl-L-alanine amidase family protein [Saccharibacillus sp. JS10]|uniref:peptidoglycan recognition protein family protein n=1 Tax=Saccharibacillus sp. JS10 TaxID=2950552 RepID=UPI00210B469D|nr:N-acetylmuramoyl-L-alanine amidase [Saccharibacillus sp. JS10]MCQ4086685.1 N-acetylmuramoyl-L-alanine amidase [Saccharibacillus sp. JS10]
MNLSKYPIERRYIAKRSNTRPGTRLTTGAPAFFVAHDTGNPSATAENHYRYFNTLTNRSASAHTFIDDRQILEIIPTGTSSDPAEKAWHVLYNVTADNERFGYNANDAALGIELCYGGNINFQQAYQRFVWYLAFCCNKWNKDPRLFIPSHKQLDPARKIDCDNALKSGGLTLKDLIADVTAELNSIANTPVPVADFTPLPVDLALALITEYVRPAWAKARVADKQPEAEHFHRLAVNLRAAASIDDQLRPLPSAIKLHKSNVQELVFRWLSPAWYQATAVKDTEAAKLAHDRANALRLAAGLPIS